MNFTGLLLSRSIATSTDNQGVYLKCCKMVNKIWTIIFLVLYTYTANADDESPPIIKRTEWSSAPPKSINYLILPLPYVIIAHTAGPQCSTRSQCSSIVEGIRSYHMDTLSWHDIGYSFLIGGDGNVYEGAGWYREGAHTIGYNKRSIGIAFIGNFQEISASEQMLNAAHKLIVWGKSQEILRDDVRVIGARQAVNIISPGNKVYQQIQNWPEWVSSP